MAKEYPYGDGVVKWVCPEWLAENLDGGELMILDNQPDVHDYFTEHIPGAIYMCEKLFRIPKNGLPGMYIPDQAMELLIQRVGLKPAVPVVVYSSQGAFSGCGDGLEQTMAAYTLARFGHNNVYVLDGGLDQWKGQGLALSQEFPEAAESDFKVQVREEYFIDFDEFCRIKDNENVLVLDNRPPGIYKGKGPWARQGHIPGAVNLPWQDLMTSSNPRKLKEDDKINQIVEKVGAAPDKTIVCSCGTGREATAAFLLFKWYLGYPDVKIYEGSFTEWVHRDQPTVRGAEPR